MKTNKGGELCESEIQKLVMAWVRLQPYLSPYVIHVPNESKRSIIYGKMLKDMGMRKGVSDLFIAIPSEGYHGAWIEIKSAHGKPSPSQIEFQSDMKKQGYFAAITYGFDETVQMIQKYLELAN